MNDEILTADEKATIALELLKAVYRGDMSPQEYNQEMIELANVPEE